MSILNFDYDENTDILTIEGIPYSGHFFRCLKKLIEEEISQGESNEHVDENVPLLHHPV
jgi:uncharacterized protein YuzB (UPF0349 family)